MKRLVNFITVSVFLGGILIWGHPALAQSAEEYQAAVSNEGCDSIPDAELRKDCKEKGKQVDELCKTESWTCKGLETKSLRENIQGLSGKIANLKEEKDKLKDQLSSATSDDDKHKLQDLVSEKDKEIEKQSNELEFMKKSLETDLSDIELRLDKGGKCLDARFQVQELFKKASDAAKNVSDPAVKPWAEKLIDKWEEGAKKHEEATKNVEDGLENCKKAKAGDL